MKWIYKYAYWLILTVFFGGIMLFCVSDTSDDELCFYIKGKNGTEKIGVYTSDAGRSYVFLPSYAELNQITVSFPDDMEIFIDNIGIKRGADCSVFSLNQEYEFRIEKDTGVICFYRSANIPTLYIDTVSGSMEEIYADKNYEEAAQIKLYSPSGDITYADRSCLIKGRGNSTWRKNKKPFLLKLSDKAGLLNMGEASKWVLLANSSDESNLHNKLILDMANQVCTEWTPHCEYVDVYLNGQYNGLYLLAEKVESGANRIDINTGAGDFLCTVDFSTRIETLENPFYTENGRTIAICEPNILSETAKERIVNLVNQQEKILLSQEDLTQSQLVDIDSWIRKYLVDEIAGNTDADLSSSYFYYSDGVFYGGPVWDYDKAFGNTIQNRYPKAFIAKNYVKYGSFEAVYYSALFNNNSFFQRMSEVYEKDFLPVLQQMTDHDIRDTADRIAVAAVMNQIRWPIQAEDPISDPWGNYINTPESIIQYLRSKTEMLNSTLIDKVPYCTIQFEHPATYHYWTVSVPRGSILANTDVVKEPLYPEVNSVIWYVEGTEVIFDPDQPVLEDMVLNRS